MTHRSNRRKEDHCTTTDDQFLAFLDFSRAKKATRLMAELYDAVSNGDPATEFMDELGELGYPDSVVHDAFLAGYQIDCVQNERVSHADWQQVLHGIGVPDERIEQAQQLLKKIMATHESKPRQIEAITVLCGDEYFVPPADPIIDKIVESPVQ